MREILNDDGTTVGFDIRYRGLFAKTTTNINDVIPLVQRLSEDQKFLAAFNETADKIDAIHTKQKISS